MLQVSFVREQKEKVILGLQKKYFQNAEETVEELLATDQKRRQLQVERDEALAKANAKSKEIGALMKAGKKEEAEAVKSAASELRSASKSLSDQVTEVEQALTQLLYTIPNVPHESVPEGKNTRRKCCGLRKRRNPYFRS